MSWFDFLKPKTVDDVFDKDNGLLTQVGGWIERGKFTEQERETLNASQMDAVRQFVVDTLSESTDRSQARRSIAVFFIKFYSLMLFMCGMTYPISKGWSSVWFNMATSASVGGLVISITVFFFGSHAMARHTASKGLDNK
jgi:hypothetical protein